MEKMTENKSWIFKRQLLIEEEEEEQKNIYSKLI